jgi:hypothetical protein
LRLPRVTHFYDRNMFTHRRDQRVRDHLDGKAHSGLWPSQPRQIVWSARFLPALSELASIAGRRRGRKQWRLRGQFKTLRRAGFDHSAARLNLALRQDNISAGGIDSASGRCRASHWRNTCESCKSIDVRRWYREGRLVAGHSFRWSWTWRSCALLVEPHGSGRLTAPSTARTKMPQ